MAVMPRVEVHVIDRRPSTRSDLDAVLQRWSDMTGRWARLVSQEHAIDGPGTVTVRVEGRYSYERARADAADLDRMLREVMPVGVDIRIEGTLDGVNNGRVSLLGGSNYYEERTMVTGAVGRVLGTTLGPVTWNGVPAPPPPTSPPRRWTRYDQIMSDD